MPPFTRVPRAVPDIRNLDRLQRVATDRFSFKNVIGSINARSAAMPNKTVQYAVDVSCNEYTQRAYLTYFSTEGKTIPSGPPVCRAYAIYDIPDQAPDTHAMILWGSLETGGFVWWVGWSYTGVDENLYVSSPVDITIQPPIKTAGTAQGWSIADTGSNVDALVVTPVTFGQ